MNILQQTEDRVDTYLRPRMKRLLKSLRETVVDPRHAQGRRHEVHQMLLGLIAGAVAGSPSMRAVEELSARLGLGKKRAGVSDTALTNLLAKLGELTGLATLVGQVKDMYRRGQLDPVGFLRHWAAIDGKYDTLDHHAGGLGSKREKDGKVWWQVGVLRAVLITAMGRPALGQVPLAEKEGEITALPDFIAWLTAQYGQLVRNFTLDAGLWSKPLFETMSAAGYGLLCGLKENKPELHAETERVFRILRAHKQRVPAAETGWQPCPKGKIRRQLWRLDTLQGWNGWDHLRQVIMIEQTTVPSDGSGATVEVRYFVTNVAKDAISAKQLLNLVRLHWAIENDCNWTFDVVLGEDSGRWCTQNKSFFVLGIIRMIAYNLLQWLRKKHVVVQHKYNADTPRPWRSLFALIYQVFCAQGTDFGSSTCSLKPT